MKTLLKRLNFAAPVAWITQQVEFHRWLGSLNSHLELLFDGFPQGELSYAKRLVDYRELAEFLKERDETLEESAVLAAAALMSIAINLMPVTQRETTLDALQTHANENALATGIVRMLDAARSIAPQPHFEMLGYEIVGKLRGMDRAAILMWRARSDAVEETRLAA